MALYDSYTDKQLTSLLKEEDAGAFTEIYQRYWRRLLVYVMRVIHQQPEAEDIVQELFVSIWRRRLELDIEHNLSTYLYNSARYLTLRYIEKNITRSNHLQRLTARLGEGREGQAPEIEAEIFSRELQSEIDKIVETLPPKMQQVFLLSRREHLSYKEIAERLSISEETVRKQIHNSLRILRENLGPLPVSLFAGIAMYYF